MERSSFTNSGFPLSRASNEGEALRLGIYRLRPVPEGVRHIVEGDLPALQSMVAANSEVLAPVRTTDGTTLSLFQVAIILNQPELCRWLSEQDVSEVDGVASLQLAEYPHSLEPEEWHNRVEKERELKPSDFLRSLWIWSLLRIGAYLSLRKRQSPGLNSWIS